MGGVRGNLIVTAVLSFTLSLPTNDSLNIKGRCIKLVCTDTRNKIYMMYVTMYIVQDSITIHILPEQCNIFQQFTLHLYSVILLTHM